MKTFKIYKNIRKRAMIMGLPISLFALMMTAVIGSLLFIIFSFSFSTIVGVFLFNGILFIALTQVTKHPSLFHFIKVFPQTISNKKQSVIDYEGH
jgi:type IV secretory pathway VirB3-like protein